MGCGLGQGFKSAGDALLSGHLKMSKKSDCGCGCGGKKKEEKKASK
jgi:hypothetical protein